MKKLQLTIGCFFLLFSLLAQPTEVLRIDPENAQGANVGQVFDSVQYVPLQTNKQSLFGRVDQMFITDGRFFILDHSTDAILVFSCKGAFIAKMDLNAWVHTSNRESLGIKTFAVNEHTREIVIQHWMDQGALYFLDYGGRLLRVERQHVVQLFGNIDSRHYLVQTTGDVTDRSKGESGNCLIVDDKLQHLQKYLLKELPSSYGSMGNNICSHPGLHFVFYTRPYDYKAYSIDSNGIEKIIQFVFPLANTLPGGFLKMAADKQQGYIMDNPGVVYAVSNLFRIDNYLLFYANETSANNPRLLYNVTNGSLYSIRDIIPDSTNGFLPLSRDNTDILGVDRNAFYMSAASYEVLDAFQQYARPRNIGFDPIMMQFLLNADRKANPVIVRIVPKKNS